MLSACDNSLRNLLQSFQSLSTFLFCQINLFWFDFLLELLRECSIVFRNFTIFFHLNLILKILTTLSLSNYQLCAHSFQLTCETLSLCHITFRARVSLKRRDDNLIIEESDIVKSLCVWESLSRSIANWKSEILNSSLLSLHDICNVFHQILTQSLWTLMQLRDDLLIALHERSQISMLRLSLSQILTDEIRANDVNEQQKNRLERIINIHVTVDRVERVERSKTVRESDVQIRENDWQTHVESEKSRVSHSVDQRKILQLSKLNDLRLRRTCLLIVLHQPRMNARSRSKSAAWLTRPEQTECEIEKNSVTANKNLSDDDASRASLSQLVQLRDDNKDLIKENTIWLELSVLTWSVFAVFILFSVSQPGEKNIDINDIRSAAADELKMIMNVVVTKNFEYFVQSERNVIFASDSNFVEQQRLWRNSINQSEEDVLAKRSQTEIHQQSKQRRESWEIITMILHSSKHIMKKQKVALDSHQRLILNTINDLQSRSIKDHVDPMRRSKDHDVSVQLVEKSFILVSLQRYFYSHVFLNALDV